MNNRSASGIALAFGAATISGVAVFLNGYGVRVVRDATVYTTSKNLVAALLLGLLALAMAGRSARPALPRTGRQFAGLAALAVLGGSVPFVLFFEGLARASSTHAAFVQKTLVVWVAALAVPLLGERLRAAHVAAMALIVGGLVLLDGGLTGFRLGDGEVLILAATLLWAVEVVVAKRLLAGLAPATVGLARMGLGLVVLLGWLAVTGRLAALTQLSGRGWAWSVLTGAVLAGYVATWFAALARAGAIDVTAVLSVGAVITALLGLAVKGTAVAAPNAVGLALLLAGAAVIAARRLRDRTVVPA
jgi:drug/metabolite transporter (DMT)-like permease